MNILMAAELEIRAVTAKSSASRIVATYNALAAYEHMAGSGLPVKGKITTLEAQIRDEYAALGSHGTEITLERLGLLAGYYWDVHSDLRIQLAVFKKSYFEAQDYIQLNAQYLSAGNPAMISEAIRLIEDAKASGDELVNYGSGNILEEYREMMESLNEWHDWLAPKPHSRR